VEAGVKFVKNRFVPLREFNGITHSNQQLKAWVMEDAGTRIHGSTREKPLVLFEFEKNTLKPLPDNPPELAVWAKVKLHGDCHVQYLKCRYSAPYHYVRQELWLRATETTVRIYIGHELIAIHPRSWNPMIPTTLSEHLPPNVAAYQMKDAQWCLKQAKDIGEYCLQAIQQLLTDSVVDYLRAAQNILGLHKKYGQTRLEAACKRALAFNSVHYRTIKTMLDNGAETITEQQPEKCDALSKTYTGQGRFCRDTSRLLH
jgi:hypothetical protein